jgi:hypothetical protein
MDWVGDIGGGLRATGGGWVVESGKWTDITLFNESNPLVVLDPSGFLVRPREGGLFFKMALVSLAVVDMDSQEDVKSSHDLVLAFLRDFWKDLRADK